MIMWLLIGTSDVYVRPNIFIIVKINCSMEENFPETHYQLRRYSRSTVIRTRQSIVYSLMPGEREEHVR